MADNWFDALPDASGGGQWHDDLPDASLGMQDMLSQAATNFVPSAKNAASDLVQPILHPINTANAMWNLTKGGMQKLIPGEQPEEAYADAFGEFVKNRYGGLENIKKTFATDPVGFASDMSMFLTGGGSAAARLPGMAGKIGRATRTVGNAVDPISGAMKGVGHAGALATGLTTGTGYRNVRLAGEAGAQGGEAGRSFLAHSRGTAPTTEVIDEAAKGMKGLRDNLYKTYADNKGVWAAANKPIDWTPVNKALDDIGDIRTFKGASGTAPKGQVLDDAAEAARWDVLEEVNNWQKLDPAEYHTISGLDALKQKIGAKLSNTPYDQKSARKVYGEVYRALRNEIARQEPTYGAAMKHYEDGIETIREIEETLSVNPKARIDTQIRKLQSILRNNANTNYNRRAELGKMLEDAGAKNLMHMLAGQGMSSYLPRGLQGLAASGMTAGAYLEPSLLTYLATSSPFAVGQGAYYAGKYGKPTSSIMYQSGRLSRDPNEGIF